MKLMRPTTHVELAALRESSQKALSEFLITISGFEPPTSAGRPHLSTCALSALFLPRLTTRRQCVLFNPEKALLCANRWISVPRLHKFPLLPSVPFRRQMSDNEAKSISSTADLK